MLRACGKARSARLPSQTQASVRRAPPEGPERRSARLGRPRGKWRSLADAVKAIQTVREPPFSVDELERVGVNTRVRHERELAGFPVVAEKISTSPHRLRIELFEVNAAV